MQILIMGSCCLYLYYIWRNCFIVAKAVFPCRLYMVVHYTIHNIFVLIYYCSTCFHYYNALAKYSGMTMLMNELLQIWIRVQCVILINSLIESIQRSSKILWLQVFTKNVHIKVNIHCFQFQGKMFSSVIHNFVYSCFRIAVRCLEFSIGCSLYIARTSSMCEWPSSGTSSCQWHNVPSVSNFI